MLKWLTEIPYRLKLNKIKRELTIKQVTCNHNFKYSGSYSKTDYSGVDIDFYDYYEAKCTECGKIVGEFNLEKLKTRYGLNKEDNQ